MINSLRTQLNRIAVLTLVLGLFAIPATAMAGVNQPYNPFGDWTGVNNSTQTSSTVNNPFGGWTGVNNSTQTSSAVNNPFAGWTGVNNANAGAMGTMTPGANNTATTNSIFGDWYGVNNSEVTNNPFGDWAGSSRSGINSTDPFGTWTGVNNFNSQGYTNNPTVASANTTTTNPGARPRTDTYFVAPTTGVDKSTPIWFAGFLTAGFLMYRKRKLIFN